MAEKFAEDMETDACVIARQALAEPLKTAIDVLNLATKVHGNDSAAAKLTKAAIVKSLLLQRVQNDLRCCIILVEHGYPLQALTQAAGIFEAWVTIANIQTEEEAAKWLSHDKEHESFGRIRPLTKQALKNITGDAKDEPSRVAQEQKMYSQYQQLCMAKHLNPIAERSGGFVREDNVIRFTPGPDTSEIALKWGWYALERASRFANLALFTIAHSEETSPTLHQELIAQQKILDALQEESAKRWPDSYPS